MQVAPRLYVKNKDATLSAYKEGTARPPVWAPEVTIVPRADCAFRRLKLPNASAQGFAALRLQALNEARSGHTDVYIRPGQSGRWVNVWTFAGPSPLRGKAVPETELQAPGADGLRLAATLSGFEGQFWRDNILLASRWWPAPPKPHQWASFLQGLDQAALDIDTANLDVTVPVQSQPKLNGQIPIVTPESFKTGALSPRSLFRPSRLALTAAVISLLSGTYLGTQFINAKTSLSAAEARLETLSNRTGNIMQDRQSALANLAAIRGYDVLGSKSILLEAWDQLTSALEGEPVTFQSFNYLDGDIEIKIEGNFILSAADIVTKIEALPAFEEVTYTLGRAEESILKAKIITQTDRS